MSEWLANIETALNYVEAHLTEKLEVKEIAKRAYVSPFYFQRLFTALCGIGIGEYIRNRRLTLAGEELLHSKAKVIDVAMKYGYDSPDSFNRAFRRFHGISPSAARKSGASLRTFAPMQIRMKQEDEKMLEYTIVEKTRFHVVGLTGEFLPETSHREIPEFWTDVHAMSNPPVQGRYGVCIDSMNAGEAFDYMIADEYIPGQRIPEGCTVMVIPAATWAVFPCCGPLPESLQDINDRIWAEWLPGNKEYRLAANMNIEMYAPPAENPEDTYSEIWIPVEKIKE